MEIFRFTVLAALALIACVRGQPAQISLTATNAINTLHIDNVQMTPFQNGASWQDLDTFPLDTYARLVAIRANNVLGGCSGLLVGAADHPDGYSFVSNDQWRCSASPAGAANDWQMLGYDDSDWTPATQVGSNGGVTPGCPWIPIAGIPSTAYWIWTPAHTDGDMVVSCRGYTPICDHSPCQNGGTCQRNAEELCDCPPRFGGQFCEESVNECDSNPCQNGGLCDLTDEGYHCQCGIGFTGINCETDVTDCGSDPCLNDGTCIFEVTGGYQCICAPGFTGTNCEIDIDECESEPCLNNGTCSDMINGVECECLPGFTGLLCQNELNECASNPCQNSGTCDDQLDGYECICYPGYEGTHCETAVGDCVTNPCQNGGTCTLGGPDGAVECICPPGWFGPLCDSNEDECTSEPCMNGGTCVDGEQSFECICPPNFGGATCEDLAANCGSIMAMSNYPPARNFWAMCEINIIDHPTYTNVPCSDLIVGIPYYNDSATIIAMGGTFGCFPTKYPDEMPSGACIPNYNQNAQLGNCLSCTHMGVCIDVPPPS